jgi:hypothetical protein
MEYLDYDYKSIKKEITFPNYEHFITNGKVYKHYLFDLGLIKNDQQMPKELRRRAAEVLKIQKLFFVIPYPIVLARLIYLYRRNYFAVNMFEREFKTVINLFLLVFTTRVVQKGILKYQADDLLQEAKKYKENYNII